MEEAKKQGINIGKRIIIGIGIFIIPTILITIYNVAYSIANDKEQVTSGELNIPTNFKNCVGCVLDATNENSCIVDTANLANNGNNNNNNTIFNSNRKLYIK